MGIDPVIQYAKAYGLGIKTGIELSGESSGIVDLKNNVKNQQEFNGNLEILCQQL